MPLMESSSLLSLLESCKSMRQGLQIEAQIILNGRYREIFPMSRLLNFFSLLGSEDGLTHSQVLFSQIVSPNVFMWNTIIRGYSRSHHPQQSILIYKSMLTEWIEPPNKFTFPFLLNSCAKVSSAEIGRQVHGHVVKFGFHLDLFVRNALMHLYSTFKLVNDAHKVFDESPVRDLVSYNSLINGYAQKHQLVSALCLFREMRDSCLRPDEFTFVAMLSAFSSLIEPKVAKQIHCLVYRYQCLVDSNILLKTTIIDMYAKCGLMNMAEKVFSSMETSKGTAAWSAMVSGYARSGETGIARRMFNQMDERDVICWTEMITGYSQAGHYTEALELFKQMEEISIKPDEVTLVAIFSACAQLGALSFGERLHKKHYRYEKDELVGQNLILSTALVDMYAKCGSIDTALDIFCRIPEDLKTVPLFNAMISGVAQHGLGKTAISVFREMEAIGLRPDGVTFVALLSACSHNRLVEEGKQLFISMLGEYGVNPQMEHYGCMVDLLGRNGCLDEAYNLIQTMPFLANSVIWRALLGACRLHNNAEMGNIAAQKLTELDPDHGARYVILSNMLANTNRWEEARKVREMMEDRGIQKPAGWSYIELNGALHRFLASDKSLLQDKELALMLKDMTTRLKSAGFVANTSQVVFDIDEEEKETVVSYHSEKLALAYGLINSSPGETIRIIKNLRICEDCHSAFKLLSGIYARKIIVRDSMRFHHFKEGYCSCMDFW